MRVIQFLSDQAEPHVGIRDGDQVLDLTAIEPTWNSTFQLFQQAYRAESTIPELLRSVTPKAPLCPFSYQELWEARPGTTQPCLLPPLTHEDPYRVWITGTGLTHTGSMQSRDQMHGGGQHQATEPETDSARMFAMGLAGGRPEPGQRGTAPEWFYKGNGLMLRGHHEPLDIPAFARDGGEEPELVGCYIIDPAGVPRRLGFALGNEWSDHATETINYLYLAPSKLRSCSVGPELNLDCNFDDLTLRCLVQRDSDLLYDSGDLKSGEQFMCHSLANCEDHHFKYPQHRQAGDVHLHYFGTSKLSHSTRDWQYQAGDVIRIEADEVSSPLVNQVAMTASEAASPVTVKSI
ncbi:MAG: AraD1 family protein [Pirellulaceae bacterium]